jgi:hypothetical protein
MARPQKNNLDYYSHDCDMRNDLKIKALRRKFSHTGYSIYVMMLEHLGNCNYLQYKWNDLSIELLTPDFDVEGDLLKQIVDYCVFLKLFEIEEGIIYSQKFYERNNDVLSSRKGFNLNNSPLMELKRNKLPDNPVNEELKGNKLPDNSVNSGLVHKVNESKPKETKQENTTPYQSTPYQSTPEQTIEEQIKRKHKLAEELRGIFKPLPDIIKLIDRDDLDPIQRSCTHLFNIHYQTILEYKSIKI